MNQNLDAKMGQANQAFAQKRFEECSASCDFVLSQLPNNIPALVLRGAATANGGNSNLALGYFKKAVEIDPKCAPAHLWLSIVEKSLGNSASALNHALDASKLNPQDPMARHQVAVCRIDAGQFAAAEAELSQLTKQVPNVGIIYQSLGRALHAQGKSQAAMAAFETSMRLEPNAVATLVCMRDLMIESYDLAGAARVAKRVAELMPDSCEANLWLARTMTEDNRTPQSEEFFNKAIEIGAKTAIEHSLAGSIFQTKGHLSEADGHFRKSIELLPEQGSAYQFLAMNQRVTEKDRPLVTQMEELAEKNRLDDLHQSQLHYALGKSFEDLGEFESAMRNFDEANRITYRMKFGTRAFDRKGFSARYDALIRIFDRNCLLHPPTNATTSDFPIFVLGMIRSGTTLVEQILSSHPDVGAGGEQRFWLENFPKAIRQPSGQIDEIALADLASRYENLLRSLGPGKCHLVDKMPMNFELVGLLHLAFPNSKILLTQRHPIDTCISIYTTTNRTPIEWSNNRENIVFAYRQYERLVDHWMKSLPEGVLKVVNYEDLVYDREAITREMVEFCNLPWDPACLAPEKNKRLVVTPSVWQVRQPVYNSSIDRWKRYINVLGAFSALLSVES